MGWGRMGGVVESKKNMVRTPLEQSGETAFAVKLNI